MEKEELSPAVVFCPKCMCEDMQVRGMEKLQIVCKNCGFIVEHAKLEKKK